MNILRLTDPTINDLEKAYKEGYKIQVAYIFPYLLNPDWSSGNPPNNYHILCQEIFILTKE